MLWLRHTHGYAYVIGHWVTWAFLYLRIERLGLISQSFSTVG